MKVLKEIPLVLPDTNLLEQYHSTFYPISKNVEWYIQKLTNNKKNVCLFSGGHRFTIGGVYIEAKMFLDATINWQQHTIFVDPKDKTLLEYTLTKLDPDILLILNSAIFIQYDSVDTLKEKIKYFQTLTKKIIISLPIHRFDFNRLKYTPNNVAEKLNGVIIDDTIVICQ